MTRGIFSDSFVIVQYLPYAARDLVRKVGQDRIAHLNVLLGAAAVEEVVAPYLGRAHHWVWPFLSTHC